MKCILLGSTEYTVVSLHKSYSTIVTFLLTHDCESFEKSNVCFILWNSKSLLPSWFCHLQFPAKDYLFLLRLHNMAVKRNAGILVLDHLQKQTIFPL